MSTKPNWGRPLMLAVALTVIAGFAYWFEFTKKPKDEEKEQQEKRAFIIKDKSIKSIRLVDGTNAFRFECMDIDKKLCKAGDNSKWDVTEPKRYKGDNSNINSLLSSLTNVNYNESITISEETAEKRAQLLKDYGLDEARSTGPVAKRIEVELADGSKLSRIIGEQHPIGDGLFTLLETGGKRDESKIHIMPSHFKNQFTHDITYWRDKKLFNLSSSEVAGFTLKNPKSAVSGKKSDGKWDLKTLDAKSEAFPGDVENVDSFISSTLFINAKTFIADDKKSPEANAALKGLTKLIDLSIDTLATSKPTPTGSASPIPEAASVQAIEPVRLEIWGKVKTAKKAEKPAANEFKKIEYENLIATISTSDAMVELDNSTLNRFMKETKDLRLSKLITSLERFGAKHLEFKSKLLGDRGIIIVKDKEKSHWSPTVASTDPKQEMDDEKISKFLDALSGTKIQEFLSGSAIPLGEQEGMTITLGDDKTDKKRQFTFWIASNKVYAHDLMSPRKEAFELDQKMKDFLPTGTDFFKKVTAASPKPGDEKSKASVDDKGHAHEDNSDLESDEGSDAETPVTEEDLKH